MFFVQAGIASKPDAIGRFLSRNPSLKIFELPSARAA